jgi:hypothetical protein
LPISSEAYVSFFLSTKVDFQISTVAEAARMAISIDDQYNRPVALSSVDVILLSMGDNDRNPVSDGLEPFVIRQPKAEQAVSGGNLHVEGMLRPFNKQPVIFKLVTYEGAIVGLKQVFFDPPADGRYLPFSIDMPYSVTQLRNTRLIVYQEGEHIPGVIALNSVEIYLKP